jgi:hypothetical protein
MEELREKAAYQEIRCEEWREAVPKPTTVHARLSESSAVERRADPIEALAFWIERLIPGKGRQAFVTPEHNQRLSLCFGGLGTKRRNSEPSVID